jgi:hypothetical protein
MKGDGVTIGLPEFFELPINLLGILMRVAHLKQQYWTQRPNSGRARTTRVIHE